MDEAGRRDPLAVLDEAVERTARRHQAGNFVGVHISDGAGQDAMLDMLPLRDAALFQPRVQGINVGEAWHRLPQPPPRILNVLLDLSFLPTRCRITELGLKQVMAGHGREPGVDLPGFASADPVDCRLHVIEDPTLGDATQHAERVVQGVEQHLVGLQQIGPHDEGFAVRQLGVRHLQLGPFAAEHGPVLAPVKLESLARGKNQRHECAPAGGLGITLTVRLPLAHESRNPAIGAIVTKLPQVRRASASPCAAACVTCPPQPEARQQASRQTGQACSAALGP